MLIITRMIKLLKSSKKPKYESLINKLGCDTHILLQSQYTQNKTQSSLLLLNLDLQLFHDTTNLAHDSCLTRTASACRQGGERFVSRADTASQ